MVAVETSVLVDELGLLDGAEPWEGAAALTADLVVECLRSGLLRPDPGEIGRDGDTTSHVARVAWLVGHWSGDGSDAPEVEVDEWGTVTVNDGWHRLHAAAVRGDRRVHLQVGGYLDAAEGTFGTTIV